MTCYANGTHVTFEELKDRLRAAFIKQRRRKMPNYHGGETLEKFLDPAARICVEEKISPEDYCAALYAKYGGLHDAFYPSQLQGSVARQVAQEYCRNFEGISPEKLWQAQVGLFRQVLGTKRKTEDILFDGALAFSPWFRIVLTNQPDVRIIRKYGAEAKKELTPALRNFLQQTVPPAHLERILKHEQFV